MLARHQLLSFVYNVYEKYEESPIGQWAIPEIRCTPPKEDMGIPKILTTFETCSHKMRDKSQNFTSKL